MAHAGGRCRSQEHLEGRGKYTEWLVETEIKKRKEMSLPAVLTAYSQITNDEVQGLYVVM
jgi:hypothetical protein